MDFNLYIAICQSLDLFAFRWQRISLNRFSDRQARELRLKNPRQ